MTPLLHFPAITALLVLTACGNGGDAGPPPAVGTMPDSNPTDLRAYMHGIEAVKGADGRYLIFFSSSKIPPTGPDQQGDWTHDVYVSNWGAPTRA